jgi:hypothetical protein
MKLPRLRDLWWRLLRRPPAGPTYPIVFEHTLPSGRRVRSVLSAPIPPDLRAQLEREIEAIFAEPHPGFVAPITLGPPVADVERVVRKSLESHNLFLEE